MKASIIIPCYNIPEEYIQFAVKSALNQDFDGDYEIILVDDGSKPEYHAYLEKLERRYEIVRLITLDGNRGVSTARNTGVENALGEYIAFLDADDALAVNFLREACETAIQTGAEFVIGGTQRTAKFEDFRPVSGGSETVEIYQGADVERLKYHLISDRNFIKFGKSYIGRGPWARLLKKGTALRYPFVAEIRMGEDEVWHMELLSSLERIAVVKRTWYWYRVNINSVSYAYNPKIYDQHVTHVLYLSRCLNLGDDEIYKRYCEKLQELIVNIWNAYLRYIDKSAERQEIQAALYGAPWDALASRRYWKLAFWKSKIFCAFYKSRLLYAFLTMRGVAVYILKGRKSSLPVKFSNS